MTKHTNKIFTHTRKLLDQVRNKICYKYSSLTIEKSYTAWIK